VLTKDNVVLWHNITVGVWFDVFRHKMVRYIGLVRIPNLLYWFNGYIDRHCENKDNYCLWQNGYFSTIEARNANSLDFLIALMLSYSYINYVLDEFQGLKKLSIQLFQYFFYLYFFKLWKCVGVIGRGSERRISERRQAKNFRTSKWSF
jgi:hypothetical protein